MNEKLQLIKNMILGKLDKKRNSKNFFIIFLIEIRDKVGIFNIKRLRGKKHLLIKYNAIYFKIQKVANTSLMSAFEEVTPLKRLPYKRDLKKKEYDKSYKFTFVRNPFDRIVSCYLNKIANDKQDKELGINSTFLRYHQFYPGMSFKEFVKVIHKIPDRISDLHFRSQYKFLINKKGKIIIDFMGKFENLEEDYEKICKKIGIKNIPKLPHKRKSKREDYRDYYDDETKKLVAERYKKDLELLRYKF